MSLLDENIIERTDKLVPMAGAKCLITSWGLRVPQDVFIKRFNEWTQDIKIGDWDTNNLHDLFQHILCDLHRTKWFPGSIFCPLTFVFKDSYETTNFSAYHQPHRFHEMRCIVQFETYDSMDMDNEFGYGKSISEVEIWPLPLIIEPARECLQIKTESETYGVCRAPFPYCI